MTLSVIILWTERMVLTPEQKKGLEYRLERKYIQFFNANRILIEIGDLSVLWDKLEMKIGNSYLEDDEVCWRTVLL